MARESSRGSSPSCSPCRAWPRAPRLVDLRCTTFLSFPDEAGEDVEEDTGDGVDDHGGDTEGGDTHAGGVKSGDSAVGVVSGGGDIGGEEDCNFSMLSFESPPPLIEVFDSGLGGDTGSGGIDLNGNSQKPGVLSSCC